MPLLLLWSFQPSQGIFVLEWISGSAGNLGVGQQFSEKSQELRNLESAVMPLG